MDNDQSNAALIGDAIDTICQYLELKDLCNVAQVCKSWSDAASREKLKRLSIQKFSLPYELNNLASKLDVNRSKSLLIYDSNFFEMSAAYPEQTEIQLMKLLNIKRIRKTIVLIVENYLTTEELEFDNVRARVELLGYFFPNVERRTQVRMACIEEFNPDEIDMQIDRLGEELGFDDCEFPKSTLLLLIGRRQTLNADSVINKLRRRVNRGEQMTWIGIFGDRLRVSNCNVEDLKTAIGWQDFVAIRISGIGVESWTTFIHCLAQRDVIEQKLQALKKKVTHKRYYTGLIYSHKCIDEECDHKEHICCNSHEIMRYLNRVFPDIPFVGLFQKSRLLSLTSASHSFGQDNGYCLFLYTSIMIISYD